MQQEHVLTPSKITAADFKAWFVCLSAGLFFFYDFIQLNMFNTLNPYVAQAFHLDAVGIGYLASTYMFATVCMLPFSGALLDRFPTRQVILVAMHRAAKMILKAPLPNDIARWVYLHQFVRPQRFYTVANTLLRGA